jgi:hypothetical protein
MLAFSKHRCQKRSDWMLTINHPITVNITNKCAAVFTAVLIMSSMIPLTMLSLDTDETVRNLSIDFP